VSSLSADTAGRGIIGVNELSARRVSSPGWRRSMRKSLGRLTRARNWTFAIRI